MQTRTKPSRRLARAARGASRQRRASHLRTPAARHLAPHLARRLRTPGARRLAPQLAADRRFVDALLADQPHAWSHFFTRFDASLCERIRATVRQGSLTVGPDEHDDIRSNFLVSLLANDKRKLRLYDPRRGLPLAAWLGVLVTNCALDHVRAMLAHRGRGARTAHATQAPFPLTPEDLLARKQQVLCLLDAADTLADRERELFELHYWRELPATEIAERMRTKLQTVYARRQKVDRHLLRVAGPLFRDHFATA